MDNSITMSWFFNDEHDAYAMAVQNSLSHSTVVVPSLWFSEAVNTLLVGERRKRATHTAIMGFLTWLLRLPMDIDERPGNKIAHEIYVLAMANDLSAYDAAYLELALRRELPLATLDKKLRIAATKAGVNMYTP